MPPRKTVNKEHLGEIWKKKLYGRFQAHLEKDEIACRRTRLETSNLASVGAEECKLCKPCATLTTRCK